MKEINKQHDQLSGHLGIIAVPIPNIKAINGNVIECFSLENNYELNCNRDSITLSSQTDFSKAGTIYRNKVTAFIEGRSEINDNYLEELLKYQIVILLQNWDGQLTRIGEISKGLIFTFEYVTASQPEGVKGYQISFSGDTLCKQAQSYLI